MQTGHPLTIHIYAVQFVHKRGTHITRLAQGSKSMRDLHFIFVRLKMSLVIWCVACLIPDCCLTCFSPRAHHLPHSLFLPRHKNTQHNRYNQSNSENTQYIHAHLQAPSVDKVRHQESFWREDLQSGGNPRTTTTTGYKPIELDRRLSWRSTSII